MRGAESTSLTGMRPMTHCEASYEPLHRSLGNFLAAAGGRNRTFRLIELAVENEELELDDGWEKTNHVIVCRLIKDHVLPLIPHSASEPSLAQNSDYSKTYVPKSHG